MENYVAGQLAALGAAVALGAAGGLVYDLLRVLRRRRPGLTHAADAVFGGMRRCCGPCGNSGPMWPESWRGFCGCPWIFAAIRQKNCCRKQKRASILRQSTLY